MSTEQLIVLFQESRHENISFTDKSKIRAIEAITLYSGKPMFVVIEIALDTAALDTAALDTAETVDAAETVEAADITLVRIIILH